jgi:2-polyprenyl-3-methyl-5-hydroxy-6-metoxy-1,4-benzoquinol methylase
MNNSSASVYDEYFESTYKHCNNLTPKHYEKMAEEFDTLYAGIVPRDKKTSFLDIGCGTGQFLYYLAKKGYRDFLGIDVSRQQIDYCKKNISENVHCVDAFEFLNDKVGSYDVITAHDVLEHIPKHNSVHFVQLIHSALKSKGMSIMRMPNMSNPFSLDSRYNDFTHEIGVTEKSLYQLLWLGGFRNIEILPSKTIMVRNFRNRVRKILVKALHGFIKFSYYIQDFTVPENLDKNLIVVAKKE